jgi:hypothetical protein
MISRRRILQASAALLATPSINHGAEPAAKVIASLARDVILTPPPKTLGWFHPRCCLVPNAADKTMHTVLMTVQSITGSDVFHHVYETQSDDLGRTWQEPKPIADMSWHDLGDGLFEGVCDTVPQWHPQTRTVLAMGTTVFYRDNKLTKPSEDRCPAYTVRGKDGKWSLRKKLVWDDPRASALFSCGSSERVLFENGDVLVPVTFGQKGRGWRSVTTLRCSFDGETLTVKEAGNELINKKGRGLLEPSVGKWGGKYFLTIRAEDYKGYVSTSDDGMKWSEPVAYAFDDGEPVTMFTTQQHWLPHSEAMHLVYNRKTDQNANVVRYRAPLFIAELDPVTLKLRKATEQVLLPLVGDPVNDPKRVRLTDNFHPLTVSAEESWITVGENTLALGKPGDCLIARVKWARPNRLFSAPT